MNGEIMMAGKARKAVRVRPFLGAVLLLAALLLMTTLSAVAAQAGNQVLAVKMEDGASSPTVLIETSEAVGYRYTVYDSFDPVRVVVDFPGMKVDGLAESIAVGTAPVQELRVAKFDLASGSLARVEIVLSTNAGYQISLADKQFRIAFAAPAVPAAATLAVPEAPVETKAADAPQAVAPVPAASEPAPVPAPAASEKSTSPGTPATVVKGVTVTPGQALVSTDGAVDRVEQFILANPARLVVDLFGLRPEFKQRVYDAHDGIKKVRVGSYPDKVRLVFDAAGKSLPGYRVEKQDAGVVVIWGAGVKGDEGAVPAVAAKPAPPAADVPAAAPKQAVSGRTVSVEALDFMSHEGRSYVVLALSGPANISQPVQEGNLVRFDVRNASIKRSLRRSIDTSAFPSSVKLVTPYLVNDNGEQVVRVAVELKEVTPFVLSDEGAEVKLVFDDGPYARAAASAVAGKQAAPGANKAASNQVQAEEMSQPAPETQGASLCGVGPDFRSTCPRISLTLVDTDVREVLLLIQDTANLNIVANEKVKGRVTLFLKDVPWDFALAIIMDIADLEWTREGNVIRVLTRAEFQARKKEETAAQKVEVEEGALETRVFTVSYSKVDDIKTYLAGMGTKDRGSILSDSRNKQLIVKDVASVLVQMEELIKRVDRPERQVMIEARIVEANTNFARQLGVKWNFDYNDTDGSQGNTDITDAALGLGGSFLIPLTNPAAAGLGSNVSIGALDGDLNIDMRISALDASGEGKIISTPRVTTLNGQKAVISQGTKIPYVTTSDTGTNVSFENAELKLDVTPEINPDGSVILDIKASNSAVGTVYQTSNGETPAIDEKKAETKVLVRNGQTTVIGGIFVESERSSETGVPYLMNIPYLGWLFKSTSKSKDRRELLIFITPRILES